jgi:hypothetical protein
VEWSASIDANDVSGGEALPGLQPAAYRGPVIPPSRNPAVYRPLARLRWPLGTLASSSAWALTENMAEPSPPAPRSTSTSANDRENPDSMLLTKLFYRPAASPDQAPAP